MAGQDVTLAPAGLRTELRQWPGRLVHPAGLRSGGVGEAGAVRGGLAPALRRQVAGSRRTRGLSIVAIVWHQLRAPPPPPLMRSGDSYAAFYLRAIRGHELNPRGASRPSTLPHP